MERLSGIGIGTDGGSPTTFEDGALGPWGTGLGEGGTGLGDGGDGWNMLLGDIGVGGDMS